MPTTKALHKVHDCVAVVLGCIDHRIHDQLGVNIHRTFGPYDTINLAGGPRNLLNPQWQEFVLEQIAISLRLHHITTVVLAAHWDCGAYGGSTAFDHDSAKETATYTADLKEAAKIVQERFPELKVVTLIATLDGHVKTVS